MKSRKKIYSILIILSCLCLIAIPQAMAFEPLKGDLSNYDPNNQTFPTSGDTIKVAIWDVFTGPNAFVGQSYWALLGYVVQDINSQGGILVDGKRKKIQIFKADTQGRPAPGKSAAEKAVLQDKVVMYQGVAGSHVSKAGQQVGIKLEGWNKAKVDDLLECFDSRQLKGGSSWKPKGGVVRSISS